MSDVTHLVTAIEHGDQRAAAELLPLVYNELRQLAAKKLAREAPGHTLQTTSLVHEAYIRLVDVKDPQLWSGRKHFFAAAAEAMRRILVDHARQKAARKRGGHLARHQFQDDSIAESAKPEEVLAVHNALDRFAAEDSLAAELVKLHYFGGFSLEDAAERLGMSRATGYRMWTYARAWLRAALRDEANPP